MFQFCDYLYLYILFSDIKVEATYDLRPETTQSSLLSSSTAAAANRQLP